MSERVPDEAAAAMINDVNATLNQFSGPSVSGEIAIGVLAVRSNLAIAGALLAVADAMSNAKAPSHVRGD